MIFRSAGSRTAVLVSVLVSALLVGAWLSATGGRFVPVVTDLYVVCQYARAMAEGHPFRYNPGEAPSTGATSLLHTALLAAAWKIGFRGDGLVAFAVALGALLFFLTCSRAARLGERLAGPASGALAGLLVALGGPVAWSFLYGSDVALFTFLATWLFERLVATWPTPAATSVVIPACLLALARPEGLPIAIVLGLVWLAGGGGVRALWPALCGSAWAFLNWRLTGAWLGSSGSDKSLLASYGVGASLALFAEYAIDLIRGLLLGFYPSQAPLGFARGWASLLFPPLGLAFVLAGLVRAGIAVRLWVGLIAAVWVIGSFNVFLGVHFNRYLVWAFPSLLVLVAVGLRQSLDPRHARAVAALFVVLGALSTLRFAFLYAEAAGSIARRELSMARFVSGALPKGASIASAATSIEYLTGHRNLNLHGVTTPAFFGSRTAEREAGVLEALARLTASERPAFLLTSDAAQAAQVTLRTLADGPPLFRTESLSEDELLLHRTRWEPFEAARSPQLAASREAIGLRREVDRLNVGDPRDEARHAYHAESQLGDLTLAACARVAAGDDGAPLADAGRAILGLERFRLRHSPGRELLIVLRTAPEIEAGVWSAAGAARRRLTFGALRLELRIGGDVVVRREERPRADWDELALVIPARYLPGNESLVEVRGQYAAFRYWAYQ